MYEVFYNQPGVVNLYDKLRALPGWLSETEYIGCRSRVPRTGRAATAAGGRVPAPPGAATRRAPRRGLK
ncbi:hypothetical protein [Massilia phosphatilytica]